MLAFILLLLLSKAVNSLASSLVVTQMHRHCSCEISQHTEELSRTLSLLQRAVLLAHDTP